MADVSPSDKVSSTVKKEETPRKEEAKPKPEATVAAEGTSDNDSDEEKKTRRAKNTRSSARIKSNQRGDKRTNTIALEEMQMRPPSPQTTRKVQNNDTCDACGEGGDLVCCDKCPASFHFFCVDPPLRTLGSLPDGDWFCKACAAKEHPLPLNRPRTEFSALLDVVDHKNPTSYTLPDEIKEHFQEREKNRPPETSPHLTKYEKSLAEQKFDAMMPDKKAKPTPRKSLPTVLPQVPIQLAFDEATPHLLLHEVHKNAVQPPLSKKSEISRPRTSNLSTESLKHVQRALLSQAMPRRLGNSIPNFASDPMDITSAAAMQEYMTPLFTQFLAWQRLMQINIELRELHEKRANDDEEKKPETTTEIPSSTIIPPTASPTSEPIPKSVTVPMEEKKDENLKRKAPCDWMQPAKGYRPKFLYDDPSEELYGAGSCVSNPPKRPDSHCCAIFDDCTEEQLYLSNKPEITIGRGSSADLNLFFIENHVKFFYNADKQCWLAAVFGRNGFRINGGRSLKPNLAPHPVAYIVQDCDVISLSNTVRLFLRLSKPPTSSDFLFSAPEIPAETMKDE